MGSDLFPFSLTSPEEFLFKVKDKNAPNRCQSSPQPDRGPIPVSPARQVTGARLMSSKKEETDAEFDARFEAYFNRADIDGWEIRKAMHDLSGIDMVPEPTIVAAALRACRRVNDYALTTRFLEVVKYKGDVVDKNIWPYMVQELRPTLDELGVLLPEEMGYDKPELMLPNPYEM